MNLIEEKVLRFKEGNSDKVYKVMLLEVSNGKYYVNFAFGKFGAVLKEGTKTDTPVSLVDAKRIFDDLISSKVKKGYSENLDNNQQNNPITIIEKKEFKVSKEEQIREILFTLENPQSISVKPYNKDKKSNKTKTKKQDNTLSRAIWRAGELRIKDAKEPLLKLLNTKNELDKYSVIWALGYCGDESCVNEILGIYKNVETSEMIKRISLEALLKIADKQTKDDLIKSKTDSLSSNLKEIYKIGKSQEFCEAAKLHILNPNNINDLEKMYYIFDEDFKDTFVEMINLLPLKSPNFKTLRHIFKISEYRFDPKVYGAIARKFDKEKFTLDTNNYKWNSGWGYYYTENGYLKSTDIKNQLKTPSSKFAFTSRTKHYMERRVNRFFRKLGRDNNTDFVKMAVGVLLAYTDKDAEVAKTTSKTLYNYKTNKSTTIQKVWDKFASSLILNNLLYANSERYAHNENSRAWHCINGYKPGDPIPEKREELYPEMWDKIPEGLIHLLVESNCSAVHDFAVRAITDKEKLLKELDTETLLILLEKPYKKTAELAFKILREKFDPNKPDIKLINILVNSISEDIRKQAIEWMKIKPDFYLNDINFIFPLMISEFDDIRDFIKESGIEFNEDQNKSITAKLISYMLSKSDNYHKSKDIAENLKFNYNRYLKSLGINIIKDLLNSNSEASQELGAYIIENHNIKITDMPYELLETIINSDFESVRAIGVKLVSRLSPETALLRIPLIMSLIIHKLPDIRMESRTLVDNLIKNSSMAEKITEELIKELKNKQKYKDLHQDILFLLQNQLSNQLNNLDLYKVLDLIYSKNLAAQDLGGNLLLKDINIEKAKELDIIEVVRLSNHEVLSVRQASWKIIITQGKDLIADKKKLNKVMRFFDSKREDSRKYASAEFAKLFSDNDWTPELLIGLCDSIYPDVREFGISMIRKMFKSEHGIEYLTKLSESPSSDIQFFATSYLDEYVKDDIEKIKELVPYFKRVLANVNRSRTAKNRILNFLSSKYKNNIDTARIIADIISWYSATDSINDKSKAITLMLNIAKEYPGLDLPLKINSLEVRNAL